MKTFLLILLLGASAFCAEPSNPFDDGAITGFSTALVPLLTSFEQASIQTTLRGFIARGDSFPGFRQSEREPSEYGLYLNVTMNEDVKKFSDHREQKGGLTHRLVQIPAPKQGQQSFEIELVYGPLVEPETIRAIDTCIRRMAKLQKAAKP